MKSCKNEQDVRKTMQPLERLDLVTHHTVSSLVEGMRWCSFGARMLGNVAATLTKWCNPTRQQPIVIYDGWRDTPIYSTLLAMRNGLVDEVLTTGECLRRRLGYCKTFLVIGEVDMVSLNEGIGWKNSEVIFINKSGQTLPKQYKDGYFPNMIPTDPAFVLPVLCATLRERLFGEKTTVTNLFCSLSQHGGLAREVVYGADTLSRMVHDPEMTVFMTLSGAMTVAKMGLLIDNMIRFGMVDYISSTGALMAHGLIEGVGLKHYAYDPTISDEILARQGLNRVTDTIEPEENFDHIDKIIHEVLSGYNGKRPLAPSRFHRDIGRYLKKHYPNERAILKSAYEQNVPIVVPAFTDSEIGNDIFVHNLWRKNRRLPRLVFNQELDTEVLLRMAASAKRLGIFSIGGGVPRNNTQNVAPLIEIINSRLKKNLPPGMFSKACRIDPTPLYYGNLSGCTYSEGGSWRKFDLGGELREVHADATIVLPFMLKYVLENFQGRERRLQTKRRR